MSSNLKNATAVFGGSFNPPTKAHLSVIEGASKRFGRVIVMPAAVSPFKIGADVISGEDRISLLSEMTAHLSNVIISDYEIKKEGVSYTYLTLTHFKKTYDDLYFIIGSDNISELHRWKNLDVINSLSSFYIVPRPYYEPTKRDEEILESLKCNYAFADFIGEEGSSTLVSVAVAFDKLGEVVPGCVERYIKQKGLFSQYDEIVKSYPEFGLKPSRAEHIFRTTKSAIVLAKKNGVPAEKAVIASLCHDIGKYVTFEMLESKGVTLSQEAYGHELPIRHCFTGEYIAKTHLGIEDQDVLNAIKYHTTGRAGMSSLEKVIFCADFIEEGRDFDGLDEIRAIVNSDLDQGMIAIIEHTLKYLERSGSVIDGQTIECLNWLRNTSGEKLC